jgi:hypothetical protein
MTRHESGIDRKCMNHLLFRTLVGPQFGLFSLLRFTDPVEGRLAFAPPPFISLFRMNSSEQATKVRFRELRSPFCNVSNINGKVQDILNTSLSRFSRGDFFFKSF